MNCAFTVGTEALRAHTRLAARASIMLPAEQ